MTIFNAERTRRLQGCRNDRLWDRLQRDWAGEKPLRWKKLACIHLRLHCQWRLEMIGHVFGHPKGHILRLINSGLDELRQSLPRRIGSNVGDIHDELTADIVDPSPDELDRRIAWCLEELDIWQRLRDEQQTLADVAPLSNDPPPQITPGSLRQRVADALSANGPCRRRWLARQLGASSHDVGAVLRECPEFVRDPQTGWSVHPFPQQAQLGLDTEPAKKPGFPKNRVSDATANANDGAAA